MVDKKKKARLHLFCKTRQAAREKSGLLGRKVDQFAVRN